MFSEKYPDTGEKVISQSPPRWHDMSSRERWVFLASLVLLPLYWLGLRVLGLHRFQAWLERLPVTVGSPLDPMETARIGKAVNSAARFAPGPVTCLTRSLLLRWLLCRMGTESALRIGVRIEERKLFAHAWVEQNGIPVNDRPEVVARYAAFDRPVAPEYFS